MDDFRIYEGELSTTQLDNLCSHNDINDTDPDNWEVLPDTVTNQKNIL